MGENRDGEIDKKTMELSVALELNQVSRRKLCKVTVQLDYLCRKVKVLLMHSYYCMFASAKEKRENFGSLEIPLLVFVLQSWWCMLS